MPIYEYACKQCGFQFEEIRSVNEADNPLKCPDCGKSEAKRKLSVFFTPNRSRKSVLSSNKCGGCSSNACGNCGL